MAHKITNNMMAYMGEKPWHGLGHDISFEGIETLSTADQVKRWLQIAGLDWTVQRRAIAMRDGVGQGLLVDPLKGFKAIVRADTNQVFQVATDRYHPLQNQQIVEFFQEYCAAGNATLETLIGLEGGSKIVALAKLKGGDATIGGTDELRGYMMLATSHDGSMRTIGMPTQVRVVCWNTLSAALSAGEGQDTTFRLKHTAKWSDKTAERAKKVMGMAIEQVQEMNETAEKLSHVSLDSAGRLEYVYRLTQGESLLDQITADSAPSTDLDSIVAQTSKTELTEDKLNRAGKAILEAIISSPGSDLPTANGTLWGAVNGATWYADHEYGRSQDTRLSASWFGPAAQLKRKAVEVARDIAGVR